MQYGPLTPLGRQLRSVLHTITAHTCTARARPPPRHLAASSRNNQGFAPAPNTLERDIPAVDLDDDADGHLRRDGPQSPSVITGRHFGKRDARHFTNRTRTDHLTEALQETGQLAVDLSKRRHKIDLSYADPQSRSIRMDFAQRATPDSLAEDKRLARVNDISMQRILADLIRHRARSVDSLAAKWDTPSFELSSKHADFLQQRHLDLQDIEAWADIATAQDSFDAAQKLAHYAETRGSDTFPIFVYLNVLKRDYISARALRLLIHHAVVVFRERAPSLPDLDIDRHPILLAVIRLLRHAREVWPQSMASIVQLMLDHLQRYESRKPYDREDLSSVTYELNKIMSLVSYTTATQPFKDNPHQEAAIVPILRYMAEHDPPLHIDRQGYRAVIRVQLAQRKTSNELQWAELKALSWPPWKVDRTAMDASIDAEYGSSRAGATLARMKEAGYRPLHWEKTAALYTGWDPDGTPTVQMRALHEPPGGRVSTRCAQDENAWPARISGTRTVQEAWACYLAWEDRKLPHDQGIYLAILHKLRQEEMRQRGRRNYRPGDSTRKAWPLLPGDTIEVAPLPPSTHLYTYTRTPPPSVDNFYETLTSRKVAFKGYCLAFLIQNATTLQGAVRRMKDSLSTYPDIAGVLGPDHTCDIRKIPAPIYAAIIEIFARFGRVPLSKALSPQRISSPPPPDKSPTVDHELNPALSITRAIDLLRYRTVTHRRLWTVLLRGLSNTRNHAGFSIALAPLTKDSVRRLTDHENIACNYDVRAGSGSESELPLQVQRYAGALNAHRIARRLLALMRQSHLDLDMVAFHSFCLSTESMASAAWSILQTSRLDETAGVKAAKAFDHLRHDARNLLRTKVHHERLKGEFRMLVGANQKIAPAEGNAHTASLPPLLVVPGPAILHAYIRALGWLGDHEGLLTTVRWMRDNSKELLERQSHDRNGDHMMRRAIIALRVFLERSWLVNSTKDDEPVVGDTPGSQRSLLIRLRRAAEAEMIDVVREVVEEVEEWGGWATDEEVEEYAADKRFDSVKRP